MEIVRWPFNYWTKISKIFWIKSLYSQKQKHSAFDRFTTLTTFSSILVDWSQLSVVLASNCRRIDSKRDSTNTIIVRSVKSIRVIGRHSWSLWRPVRPRLTRSRSSTNRNKIDSFQSIDPAALVVLRNFLCGFFCMYLVLKVGKIKNILTLKLSGSPYDHFWLNVVEMIDWSALQCKMATRTAFAIYKLLASLETSPVWLRLNLYSHYHRDDCFFVYV